MVKFTEGRRALEARVARCQIPGFWRSFEDGFKLQYKTATGEYLNYWPSTGTVMFQGRPNGLLARRFTKLTTRPTQRKPSVKRPVKVTPVFSPKPEFIGPHHPLEVGRWHSMRDADLAALNERQIQLRNIVAGLPLETAVAELFLSSVRHAVDYLSEYEVAEAITMVAREVAFQNYKWLDLYARMSEAFRSDMDSEL